MELTSPEFLTDIFGQRGMDMITVVALQVIAGILTIIVGFWISGRASRLVVNSLGKIQRLDNTIIPMIGALVRYAGMTLTIVVALGKFGVETTSIIAVLGAAGLAIGLALQGTLSNVAAGLMLVFLRPFKIGDWIESAAVSGTVREIGLFTTIIDTFDNTFISVPNSSIWSSNIINYSRYERRRLDLDVRIDISSNIDDAEKAMLELAKDPRVLNEPAPRFIVVNYTDFAVNVRLRVHVLYSDLFDLGYDLNRQLKSVLAAYNISIPFPTQTIKYIHEQSTEDSANSE